jgi:predicted DCC family thiol-disulfide oxidoreductase YuxK
MDKIVFYDHNCKICTCFTLWVKKRSNYWNFLPNDEQTIINSGIKIDLSIPKNKIVCIDKNITLGGIAILRIFSKSGIKTSLIARFLLEIKFLYIFYNLYYELFSKNRSKFAFVTKYLDC